MSASLESLEPLGDRAVRVAVVSADEGRALAAALRATGAVDDAWHTETHVAFTPRAGVDPRSLIAAADLDPDVRAALWEPAGPVAVTSAAARAHTIAVVLDGPDLDEVALAARMSRAEVERALLDATLTVAFVGFAPGFGYLRGLDARLHLPRRASPRPRVPAGSLAIAGGFAAIYPGATAGGWHLVGRALDPLWQSGEPLLAAGDRVRLVHAPSAVAPASPSSPIRAERRARESEPGVEAQPRPALVIEEIRGLAFVQDGGRVGHMHQGMPPAGALVPSALARANRAVGNADGAAGLERYGAMRVSASVDVAIATDDGTMRIVRAGEAIELGWSATERAGYVAIAGGLDVPVVLGGRGTHVRAQLGGLDGRPLRRGDRIAIGARPFDSGLADARPTLRANGDEGSARGTGTGTGTGTGSDRAITIVAGPDLDRFAPGALDRLIATTWRLAHQSDRMGTRLEGGTLPHAAAAATATSAPLVLGAIEVPPDGVPIVLGPEHPTTGGYPVVAVVVAADLDAFHARPLGTPVRFRLPG